MTDLKAWRLSLGIRQADMAAAINADKNYLCKVETGRQCLTPKFLQRIKAVYPQCKVELKEEMAEPKSSPERAQAIVNLLRDCPTAWVRFSRMLRGEFESDESEVQNA